MDLKKYYAQHHRSEDEWTMEDLQRGYAEELEHGTRAGPLNVTNDNPDVTAKIALAHLNSRADFYDGMEVLEKAPPNFWRGKQNYWRTLTFVKYIILIIIIFAVVETTWYFLQDKTEEAFKWVIPAITLSYVLSKIA